MSRGRRGSHFDHSSSSHFLYVVLSCKRQGNFTSQLWKIENRLFYTALTLPRNVLPPSTDCPSQHPFLEPKRDNFDPFSPIFCKKKPPVEAFV